MKVLVSGSHGLIGSALVDALRGRGDTVHRLVRSAPTQPGDVHWSPSGGMIDHAALAGHDAVVHLAGETVVGRWTEAKRARIRESRVDGTALLANALAQLADPPAVLVSGSAIGWYDETGDTAVTETDTPPAHRFLARVAREWEAATEPARQAGIRVVRMRTGIVQSRAGGALKAQLLPFRLGLGGRMGSGRQWLSWISRDDLVRILLLAIDDAALEGPVNAVSPFPVTNAQYTRTLGKVLRRPAVLPVPAPVLRAMLGGFASELLGSIRVQPGVLQEHGFTWHHPELEAALRHELRR